MVGALMYNYEASMEVIRENVMVPIILYAECEVEFPPTPRYLLRISAVTPEGENVPLIGQEHMQAVIKLMAAAYSKQP
jgi:hypothetical protein